MFFLFLRNVLTGINPMINTYIPIIGKIVLIFLNKFEEQIKVRNYHFIDMTI